MGIREWIEQQKRQMERFRRREPGDRFQKSYREGGARHGEALWRKALWITLGALLVLVGTLLSLPPGMPGFLLWLPGLLIIIVRVRFAARFLDWVEMQLRVAWGQARSWWGGSKG